MRLSFVLLLLAANFGLLAEEPPTPPSVADEVAGAARHEALGKMLSERESPEALERAIAAARCAGVGEQAIFEARFLFHVDRHDDSAIAQMIPELEKRRTVFRIEDSVIFSVEEDWLAVVEYMQAIAALDKGDKAAFKKHITEAFWLSPSQAAAFAPHIERLRTEESMANVSIDLSVTPIRFDGAEPQALAKIAEGKKAVLLHFWSPWSRECEEAMPDFVTTARFLHDMGIAVVSLVPADMPGLVDDARRMIPPAAAKSGGVWLIDSKEASLARLLRVKNLPTMVIVSTVGKVLFNGDPADERLWEALKKMDERIIRPASIGGAQH